MSVRLLPDGSDPSRDIIVRQLDLMKTDASALQRRAALHSAHLTATTRRAVVDTLQELDMVEYYIGRGISGAAAVLDLNRVGRRMNQLWVTTDNEINAALIAEAETTPRPPVRPPPGPDGSGGSSDPVGPGPTPDKPAPVATASVGSGLALGLLLVGGAAAIYVAWTSSRR